MKKILGLLVIIALAVSFASCGGNESSSKSAEKTANSANEGKSAATSEAETTVKSSATKTAKFELVSCTFEKDIHALDNEYIATHYSGGDSNIYVDALFEVSDAGDTGISEDNTSGELWYKNRRYEFTYCKNTPLEIGVSDDAMEAHSKGQIHMITRLPKESASKSNLEVKYNVDGIENTAKVTSSTPKKGLEGKTELKEGDKIEVDGFDASVFRCTNGNLFTTDKSKSAQFTGKYHDLVLKLTNTSDKEINPSDNLFTGYVIDSNKKIYRMSDKIEKEDNTDFGDLEDKIEPGKTRYFHILADSDKSVDGKIRLNTSGKCYYIKSNKW